MFIITPSIKLIKTIFHFYTSFYKLFLLKIIFSYYLLAINSNLPPFFSFKIL